MEEDKQVFEVKTALKFWQNLIFLGTFFLFAAGLIATFHPKNLVYFLIIFACSLALGYSLSGIAKSKAKIFFKDGKLFIEQSNSFIKRGEDMAFELKELRGFEIGNVTTRYDTSLVLYKKDFSLHRYLLDDSSESSNLKIFLAQHLPFLDSKSNPKFRSFKEAFWFALKNITYFFIFEILILSIITWLIGFIHIAAGAIIVLSIYLLFWHFVIKKSLRRNYFRFFATSGVILIFPLIAAFLFVPTIKCLKELNSKPKNIEFPKDVFMHKNEKFFYIKNIRGSIEHIIASYKTGTSSRKSSLIPISHYIETRATDLNNKFDNIWLRKELKQKTNKSLPAESRAFLINEFQRKAQKDFEKLLKRKATFYKVVFIRMESAPLAILEPYWESFKSYKAEVAQDLFILIESIILLLGLGSCTVAYHR